jgi:hypothetical protein
MSLQEKMLADVEQWIASGESKIAFVDCKDYSLAKFNYWLAKWKIIQAANGAAGFRDVGFLDVKLGKVLEIEAPSGVRITVFA